MTVFKKGLYALAICSMLCACASQGGRLPEGVTVADLDLEDLSEDEMYSLLIRSSLKPSFLKEAIDRIPLIYEYNDEPYLIRDHYFTETFDIMVDKNGRVISTESDFISDYEEEGDHDAEDIETYAQLKAAQEELKNLRFARLYKNGEAVGYAGEFIVPYALEYPLITKLPDLKRIAPEDIQITVSNVCFLVCVDPYGTIIVTGTGEVEYYTTSVDLEGLYEYVLKEESETEEPPEYEFDYQKEDFRAIRSQLPEEELENKKYNNLVLSPYLIKNYIKKIHSLSYFEQPSYPYTFAIIDQGHTVMNVTIGDLSYTVFNPKYSYYKYLYNMLEHGRVVRPATERGIRR